jgi:hypothetical protein
VEERRGRVRWGSTALIRAASALAVLIAGGLLLGTVGLTCKTPAGFEPRAGASADGVALVFRTVPPAITLGRHFSVEVIVCGDGAAPVLTRVDAQMPEHRHGMNYRPTLAPKGPGHYVAEGLLFHMPGRWELSFDVENAGRRTRLATDVVIE